MIGFRNFNFFGRFLAYSLVLASPVAFAQNVTDTQVKSVFLFNFLKFIELTNQNSESSIRLCIIGEDLLTQIRQTMNGKAVHDRNVLVESISSQADLTNCAVIFFTSGTGNATLLSNLQGKGILLVGEEGNFIQQGGIINFFIEDEKVRF